MQKQKQEIVSYITPLHQIQNSLACMEDPTI
jgi:hypothetical protein